MHKFYGTVTDVARITGEDVNHIRNVLRLKPGDEILVGDGSSRDYLCRITDIQKAVVQAKVLDVRDTMAELPVRLTLYQGMPKQDKMDFIVQKAVELGAVRIVPVLTARTIVKLDETKKRKRQQRYQEIAKGAAKQSGRGIIPEVTPFLTFREALQDAEQNTEKLIVPYENADGMRKTRAVFGHLSEVRSAGIFIGPEGGFTEEEIHQAENAGAEIVTLGHRIYRTETAGMAVLAVLGYLLEKDDETEA